MLFVDFLSVNAVEGLVVGAFETSKASMLSEERPAQVQVLLKGRVASYERAFAGSFAVAFVFGATRSSGLEESKSTTTGMVTGRFRIQGSIKTEG